MKLSATHFKAKLLVTIIVTGVFLISACVKDITVTIKPTVAPITRAVSFSKDIIPIFTAKCALTGCHAAGGRAPILTADKAFSSIAAIPGLINTGNPESSKLYKILTGKIVPAMPLNAPASDPLSINEYVFAWIKQGAKNN